MQLKIFRHLWGVEEEWEKAFPSFLEKGYGGIESRMPSTKDKYKFQKLLSENKFDFIAQAFTEGAPGTGKAGGQFENAGNDITAHLNSLELQIQEAKDMGALFLNVHSGVDAWPESDSLKFFEGALNLELKLGLPLMHETHRSRILFNPWVTARLIEELPSLKLTGDFSHWVCVAERLLEDQEEILQRCIQNVWHIHARVGYEQGPQVPDPRAPEYQRHVLAHENWWDAIWKAQEKAGRVQTTLTPEFGPPDYLHTIPFKMEPVANLEEICDWQASRQRERFDSRKWA